MNIQQRWSALLIGVMALGTLVLQSYVDVNRDGAELMPALWSQARYFTNLITLCVCILFLFQAAKNRFVGSRLSAAVSVWMVIVGLVYHVLLSATHYPEGGDVIVNLFQHTIIPIATFLFWLMYSDKRGLRFRDPIYWLACPLTYLTYVLMRGSMDNIYPYFFLDPTDIGWSGIAAYFVGLGVLFYVSGAIMIVLAGILGRGKY